MNNIWDWQSEEERKKKEQQVGTPLQGVQYKTGEQAPNPVVAGKEPSLAGTVTKMAEMRAVNKGFDKAEKGAESIWNKQAPAPVTDLSTAASVTPAGEVVNTGLATLPESVISAPLASATPIAGETAMAEGIAAAAPVAEAAAVGAPLSAAATGTATTAAAGAEAAALASNPIGWIVGGYLLGKQFGLF